MRISTDPVGFTRTSAVADIYAPIRTGTDIAFLGGIIHYLLENDLWFKDYALDYTNIATIIDERFQDAEQLDGLFSGWNEKKHAYQYESWQYRGEAVPEVLLSGHHENIRRWRLKQALGRTWLRRPELLQARGMSKEEHALLAEFQKEYREMSRS